MMMRPRLSRTTSLSLVALVATLFLSYFPLAHTRAANVSASILPSAGKPLVNLKNPQSLKVTYTGSSDAVAALRNGTAIPTALASADFDADGAVNVVAGYSTGNGGALVLFRGNKDAFSPTNPALYPKAIKGSIAPTFLSKAQTFSVPESPDLLATGDFNRDGFQDVLVGTKGSNIYLLAGDGTGNLRPAQIVPLTGQVRALAVLADGHVAVSLDNPNGSELAILSPSAGGLVSSASYPLPAPGDSIAWGNLGGGVDIAVGAGKNIALIYNVLSAKPQTETVTVPFRVMGLALGDFIWDQDGRTEISVLADDGSVQILQHGVLNTAPLTAAQIPARRKARAARNAQPSNPTALGTWTVAKQLPYTGSAPATPASASAFSSPHVAASATHDVMVLDAGSNRLNILDTSGTTASPSAAVSFSGTPVAALALPQKIDASRDVVVLTSAQSAPMIVTADASDLTFNVNTTADVDSVSACATNSTVTTPPATLSLREAVCIANNNGASAVTINVPAGTYSLSLSTFGGGGSVSSSPELQVGIQKGNNITISGAGAGSTIIQQTVTGSRIIEADQELAGDMPLVIQNLTLQNGNCTDSGLDCLDNGGGAILAGGVTGDTLTITNAAFSNNAATSGSGTMGGAVVYTGSSLSITGSTFSQNNASGTGGAQGGGVQVANVIGGSGVSGSATITNSTFSGNKASSGSDGNANGGGLFFEGSAGFNGSVSGSTFTGNTASSTASTGAATGGGINAEGGGTDTFSVSNSRIVGNSVTASSANGTGYFGLDLDGTITNDWWGCNAGPGNPGCDTVFFDQSGGGTSTFNPWLVLSISANPTQVDTGGTSDLTADLTHNNDGNGGFSVPNGTPVTFGGTLDSSVNPTNTTLTSGQAASTYTAGSTTGAGSGTAKVNNQTVSVTINIGAPPTITSANNTTFTVGVAGTFTVTTTGTPAPTLSDGGATLPSGVSFHDNGNGTATLAGTPAQAGPFPFTITAANGFTPNASQSFTLNVSQASTSISVTNVSPSSEVYGADSAVTITAVLSWTGTGPSPTTSGVTIGGNGPSGYSPTSCGTPSGDTLTCTATYTPTGADTVGTYTESASFSGDSNYTGSSSTQANNFSITQATSSTSVGSSQNPSVVGQSVTFTATIDGENGLIVRRGAALSSGVSRRALQGLTQKGSAHPLTVGGITGTVTWSSNTGCSPSSVSGDPGTSQCITTTLPQGTDTIMATYSGDTNHTGSTGTLSGGQVVNPAVTATSINVTNVSPASEVYGQDSAVTITAVLSWTGTGPAPTASDVTIGGNGPSGYSATSCGSPVSDTLTCTATYTPTFADTVGTYTETASFSGDSNYTGSSSTQVNNFSITQASSTTSVGSSQNPSNVGQSVTFTATIDGENGLIVRRNGALLSSGVSVIKRGAPQRSLTQKGSAHPLTVGGITGTVIWSANTGCGPSSVSGDPGTSQCTTTTLPQGTDTITATYSGDTNHTGSTGTLSGGQVVNSLKPQVGLKPSSVNFGTVHLSSTHSQIITVTNIGSATLMFKSVSLTEAPGNPDSFTFLNSCGSTLAPTKSCTITIGFSANKIGSSSATLNIADNAPGSPQHVSISATVINPRASLSPQSLNFGTLKVDSSTTKNVTLTNNGTTTLDIISIAITGADQGDFSQTNACPSSLNAGDKCTISVTFDPQATGARSAGLTVTDNALAGSETVSLSGTGD